MGVGVRLGPDVLASSGLPQRGDKGCELCGDGHRVPADALLGVAEGRSFGQRVKGLETGRPQVAARAHGVGRAALDCEAVVLPDVIVEFPPAGHGFVVSVGWFGAVNSSSTTRS